VRTLLMRMLAPDAQLQRESLGEPGVFGPNFSVIGERGSAAAGVIEVVWAGASVRQARDIPFSYMPRRNPLFIDHVMLAILGTAPPWSVR